MNHTPDKKESTKKADHRTFIYSLYPHSAYPSLFRPALQTLFHFFFFLCFSPSHFLFFPLSLLVFPSYLILLSLTFLFFLAGMHACMHATRLKEKDREGDVRKSTYILINGEGTEISKRDDSIQKLSLKGKKATCARIEDRDVTSEDKHSYSRRSPKWWVSENRRRRKN